MNLKTLATVGSQSVVLRALTLGVRFLFFVALARELDPTQYGIFGLFATTIMVGIQFAGVDFYIFGTRELVRHDTARHASMLRDQAVFHGLIYLAVMPALTIVFFFDILPLDLVLPFFVLIVFEHASQEIFRILVALSRPVTANVVFFLRMGSWAGILLVAIAFPQVELTLNVVLWSWVIGAAISVAYGLSALPGLSWSGTLAKPIDWSWLAQGARASAVVFMATLASRVIEAGDRYFIQTYHGEAAVGVYTFYYQLAIVAQTVTMTGLLMILYPALVRAYEQDNRDAFRVIVRQMLLGTIGMIVVMTVVLLVAVHWVVAFTGRDIYQTQIELFYWIVAIVAVSTLGLIPHLVLYSQRRYGVIVVAAVLAAVVAIGANWWLVPQYGTFGAAWATLMATIVWGLTRTLAALATVGTAAPNAR